MNLQKLDYFKVWIKSYWNNREMNNQTILKWTDTILSPCLHDLTNTKMKISDSTSHYCLFTHFLSKVSIYRNRVICNSFIIMKLCSAYCMIRTVLNCMYPLMRVLVWTSYHPISRNGKHVLSRHLFRYTGILSNFWKSDDL